MNLLQLGVASAIAAILSAITIQITHAAEPEPRSSSSVSLPVQETRIQQIRDRDRPATTLKEWQKQLITQNSPVPITGVRLNQGDAGLEIVLETPDNKPLPVDATKFRSEGNSLIADIPNAVLALSGGQEFTADSPTDEIANVRITQLNASNIRITVAGRTARPTQDVTLKTGNLAYSLNSEGEATEEELVVTGEGQRGYRVPNVSTATKTDTPLRDIPQSIQVVPQEVLRDQNATRAQDALRNVPGVTIAGSSNSAFSNFTIRGFSTLSAYDGYLRNGLRDFAGPSALELSNIDRIEVLKGPASVLFGRGALNGTINLITKQPLSTPFYEAQATVGSYDFYRGALDLSGPLNDSKTVLYRLNASYRDSGSFIDFYNSRNLQIAPVVSFAIGNNTKLTFEGEYIDSQYKGYSGLPAVGTVLPNPNGQIPHNRNTTAPTSSVNINIGRIGYALEHRFSENWSLRNTFRFVSFRNERNNLASGFTLAPNRRILNRTFSAAPISYQAYDLVTDIVGKFSTGSIQHQLVVGIDLNRTDNSDFKVGLPSSPVPLDLFNPIYSRPLAPLRPLSVNFTTLTDALGVYIQDQITLADNLKLLLGGRFDTFRQDQDNLRTNRKLNQSGEAFSPRVGIVYQPIPAISFYASYARSFNPVFASVLNSTSTLFEPERGTQYEVGVKADLNNRLSATLAFYDLTRSNVVVTNPNNSLFSLQTGEQRSQGIELSFAGEISPGWNIIAGYAYTDAEITKDTTFAVGNILNNVPKNSFNLWTTYEFQRGPLQGFGFGAGFFFVSDRQGDLTNTFELPSYFRTDAAIFYKRGRFRAALNFRNLFDVDYFESATGPLNVYPGDPFTVLGTISFQL